MLVLGLSGLDRALSFKTKRFPDVHPRERRIAQGFDAAAALVGPAGVLGAAAEERFTGQKGTERFPLQAIRWTLDAAGIGLEDVDRIAHAFSYESHRDAFLHSPAELDQFDQVYSRTAQLEVLQEHLGQGPWDEKLVQVPHHLAHAASAYLPSGFNDALILVSDGMGEAESASVLLGHDGHITPLASVPHRHSLGVLYGLFTLHLGFRFNSGEYKVMGLAPYGDPAVYFDRLSKLVRLQDDGFYNIPILQINESELERQTYRATLNVIGETFGAGRDPQAPIEQRHMDLAAALQAVLENATLHTLRTFARQTGAENLCLAGGVALNCTANGTIRRSRLFRNMFVQPAAGDDGTALGAALLVHREQCPAGASRPVDMPYWGPEEDDDAIRGSLDRPELEVNRFEDLAELAQVTAQLLAGQQIIGWFQGRMEFGPRALGNRSILADPRSPTMRQRVNALVKKREDFRPFAPAVLADRAADFFELEPRDARTFAHMLIVTNVRPEYRAALPAITHCDGSARVQAVFMDHNPRFHQLLDMFERASGVPILLNTSFNVRGQPIVRTAGQAVDTFLEAGLDALVIGPYLVKRRS